MKPDYAIWRITESEEELRAGLSHPELFATKVANLKPGSRRMIEVLAVRRAMKILFHGEEKEVLYTEDGAPYLENGPYISISHTDGWAVVIAGQEPVAIDIERRGNRVQKVIDHFLRPEELTVLQMAASNCSADTVSFDETIEDHDKIQTVDLQLFIHLAWSAKETAYKYLGKDYYDLKNLTTIQFVDLVKDVLILAVKGRTKPLQIHIDATEEFVMTYLY